MKITRRRMFEIDGALRELDKHARSFKLSYAIAKNLAKMRREIEAFREAGKPSKEYSEYDTERSTLASKFAVKNKQTDEPMVVNGQYVIVNKAGFEAELKPLREKHADAIKAQEAKAAEADGMLDEEIEIEFHTVKSDILEAEGAFADDTSGLASALEPLLGVIVEG